MNEIDFPNSFAYDPIESAANGIDRAGNHSD